VFVCPTALIHARPEKVWGLLSDARSIAAWSETRLVSGPLRPLEANDEIHCRAALGLSVRLRFHEFVPPRRVRVDAFLPFGIVNREVIEIAPAGHDDCRVTFN
jgi:hypothetical protein